MYPFDKLSRIELDDASDFLQHTFPFINSVDLVVQLGSGQSADDLFDEEWGRVPLQRMPHVPAAESLAQHRMEIIWGRVGEHRTLVYAGRFHLYEGYGRVPCVLPVWAAAACGARTFVFANAAGAINEDMPPGTWMIITDHINNLGVSPLAGHQHLLQTPYIDMTETYCRHMNDSVCRAAAKEGVTPQRGVYMANCGPQYETRAEVKLARNLGADVIGMSTVLEATTAKALGASVIGMSMITNWAAGIGDTHELAHQQAIETGKICSTQLIAILRRWLTEDTSHL